MIDPEPDIFAAALRDGRAVRRRRRYNAAVGIVVFVIGAAIGGAVLWLTS